MYMCLPWAYCSRSHCYKPLILAVKHPPPCTTLDSSPRSSSALNSFRLIPSASHIYTQ